MAFPNRFSGRCSNRNCPNHANVYDGVPVGQGWTTKDAGGYRTWCKTCCPERGEAPKAAERKLLANGRVLIGYEPANMPLLRSLPGYRNAKNASGNWEMSCSVSQADLPRVLEIADKLGLDVAPELRTACKPTEQAQAASYDSRLYPFQVAGVDHLARKNHALVCDEMGLGKTIQTLAALPQDGSASVLVICPASLKYNWRNEARKWATAYTPVVLAGKDGFRWPTKGEICIANYDILPAELQPKTEHPMGETGSVSGPLLPTNTPLTAEIASHFLGKKIVLIEGEKIYNKGSKFFVARNDGEKYSRMTVPPGITLIGDEIQMVKNYRAGRSSKFTTIANLAKKVIGLTGTPLMNRPFDLWGVLCSTGMAKEVFGSFGTFLRLFGAEKGRWGGYRFQTPGPEVAERLRRVMLRRLRRDVLPDLPDKTYSEIECNGISASLAKKLDELEEEWGGILDCDELPPFEEFSGIRAMLAESRIPAMLEQVETYEESETPLVVFSAHRAPIDALATREGWAVITGDVAPQRRQEIVDAFQAGQLKGIGLTITAGGTGLTLTRASHMLFVDLDWVPANNSQAEDRCCRIGATADKIQITRMVSDHVLDKHVQRLLVSKMAMSKAAVDSEAVAMVPVDNYRRAEGETEYQFVERMEKLAAAEQNRRGAEIAKAKEAAKSKVARIRDREMARKAKELLPLTPERTAAVRRAFNQMLADDADQASLLNGVGFNRPDSAIGHWILSAGLENEGEIELAYAILTRYHRQLNKAYPVLFRG